MKNTILAAALLIAGVIAGYQWQAFDADSVQIPLGSDPRLVGGDAEPGSPLDAVTIRAVGTEPFWSFEYSQGNIKWSAPAMDEIGNIEHTSYDVGFLREDDDYRLWGLGDSVINVLISQELCSDGMSDIVYTHKVSVAMPGMKYNGCANVELNN